MTEDGGQPGAGAPGEPADPWQPPESGDGDRLRKRREAVAGQPAVTAMPGGYGYGYGHPGGYGCPGASGDPGAPAWGGPPLPNGQSVAAMVLGIVSLVLVASCYGSVLAVITSPVALGLGLAARQKADRGELGGRDQAMAGFVMGVIGLVLSMLVTALTVFLVLASTNDGADGSPEREGPAAHAASSAASPTVADRGLDRRDGTDSVAHPK